MAKVLKEMRLEYHNDEKNSHKFYEILLEELAEGKYRIKTRWGRCRGFSGAGRAQSQPKDFTGNIVEAMTIFHDWVHAKQKKGYKPVN